MRVTATGLSIFLTTFLSQLILFGIVFNFAYAEDGGSGEDLLDAVERQYGKQARERVIEWKELIHQLINKKGLDDGLASSSANDFFNQLPWLTDQEHWGQEDYWATPLEMLVTNGGDCEDFSIGKYFTLSETGIDTDKIRITYVKALDYNQAHMVLAYYPSPEAEPLILDNINKTILPASQRSDLLPIYSFNGDGLWLAKSRKNKLSSVELTQWNSVIERVGKEMKALR